MVVGAVICVIVLSFQNFAVECVGTGRVVIGQTAAQLQAAGLTENPSQYIFSGNDATSTFPIYLDITPSGTAFDSGVNVFCETSPAGTVVGYTQITFANPVLTVAANTGTLSGSVSFAIGKAGRAVAVQCYGVSTVASADAQFARDSSISSPVNVQVKEPATVNFCTQTVTVPNIFGQTSSSFTLELSEPVQEDNVTVSCSVTTDTTSGGFLGISVTDNLAEIDKSSVTMSYTITAAVGNDIIVACTAQSENGGTQFVVGTSGDQATFTEDKAAIKFYPMEQRIYGQVFEPILMLDEYLPQNAKEVNFACETQHVIDQDEIKYVLENYVCLADPGIQPNSTTLPILGNEWVIADANPVFKPGEYMKQLRVERNSAATNYSREYVLLICCVPSTINQSPKYVDKVVSMLVDAEMNPTYAVNFNTATDSEFVSETVFPNPAFVNIAPCPCDLTPQICDVGCCCDANCTDGDKLIFDCLPGMFGGASQDGYKDESCLANPYPKPNWHNMLCVISEENPLLGSRYPTIPVIKTNTLFGNREQTAPNLENFAKTQRTASENVNTTAGYTLGARIRTQGENGISGILSMPRTVFDGRCERKTPVRFLTDMESGCVTTMTEAQCKNAGSSFNAQSYAQSSAITSPPCPVPLGVVSHPSSTHANPKLVTVSANYYCATSLDSYLIERQPSSPPASSFSSLDKEELENCAFNDIGVYECKVTVTPSVTATPSRCSFDNGETQPPTPVWDAAKKICRNAVVDVRYTFTWSGTSVSGLAVDMVLADIPVLSSYTQNVVVTRRVVNATSGEDQTETITQAVTTTYPSVISQRFNVQFHPSTTSQKTRDPNLLPRISGNPGYIPYKPIIGAVQIDDNKWDADEKYWPRYFNPNSQYLDCPNVGKGQVNFEETVTGMCLLNLSFDDFMDCDLLRSYIVSTLDSVFPMEFVSMVGNPNLTEPSHWLRVDRQNLTDVMSNDTTVNSTMELSTSRCSNMPIGIYLDVMHADAGTLNDKYIQRLVNAKITYELGPMEMKCMGEYAKDCVTNATGVQPFTLFSSTNFLFVRSDLYVASRWERFHWQCTQEFCKEEAMFPFTGDFQGATYEQSLLWMIACFCFALFIFMITKPWW